MGPTAALPPAMAAHAMNSLRILSGGERGRGSLALCISRKKDGENFCTLVAAADDKRGHRTQPFAPFIALISDQQASVVESLDEFLSPQPDLLK